MKNSVRILSMIFIALLIASCNKEAGKESSENNKNKIDLSTQANYEKFLADWGITIPEKASFKELKKTNDGNYKIFYNLEPYENIQDSLQIFYENQLDNILISKGWAKAESGWNPHGTEYKNDSNYFKFFIVVSEKYNVYELSFKYGQ
ncbi:MAG: hypothetical protein AB7S50_09285 [Bacteroidales bacterium]